MTKENKTRMGWSVWSTPPHEGYPRESFYGLGLWSVFMREGTSFRTLRRW